MDFIIKLPKTAKKHDYIMVLPDKLTKATHFISVKSAHKAVDFAEIYMREISKLHGVPKTIVSHRDSKFTLNFWKGLFKEFGTKLNFNTSYHPETYGQIERVNRVIEDMLRMYVMDKPSKWEDYLHLVEFAYNNGYQAYLKMSPFEALYGRKYNPIDHEVVGPDILWETEE
jgi:transposase InsO family protein